MILLSEGRNHISAYSASEGVLYLLFLMVLALHAKSPRLFAVDHVDQAMHPRLARAATRLFCEYMLASNPPRQALLTTHNPLVLDGLNLLDDRIRLFAVERNSRGHTCIYRIEVSPDVLNATQLDKGKFATLPTMSHKDISTRACACKATRRSAKIFRAK